jgi:YVTN family beta-propeller protein
VEAATIPVGSLPYGVAVTPDGKHAYVTNEGSNNVSVIDTATNTVEAATIPVGSLPYGVAVTPDGKHAYVTNEGSNSVSVIDTATNTVEAATIPVGTFPQGVAITPDGEHAYVANFRSNNLSVIATASNTVVATIPVGTFPRGVAVTPDGKHAYVANYGSDSVSVIDAATNTVMAMVGVGNGASGVGIIPPPVGVPFLAFSAKLAITFGGAPNEDSFNLHSPFTLSSTAPALHPHRDSVTLQVGTFSITIPLLQGAAGRVFHLRGGDQWREPEGTDLSHGHLAICVSREGDGREPDRGHEAGLCDPDHRWRHRRDPGQEPHFLLKRVRPA